MEWSKYCCRMRPQGSIPTKTSCEKVGSYLPMVASLQYRPPPPPTSWYVLIFPALSTTRYSITNEVKGEMLFTK